MRKIPAFSPVLETVRYTRFQKLVEARHIAHGKRLPAEIREFIIRNSSGLSIPELSEKVLDKFGIVLSFETVQRWANRPLRMSN